MGKKEGMLGVTGMVGVEEEAGKQAGWAERGQTDLIS